jgi:hypothetical protein
LRPAAPTVAAGIVGHIGYVQRSRSNIAEWHSESADSQATTERSNPLENGRRGKSPAGRFSFRAFADFANDIFNCDQWPGVPVEPCEPMAPDDWLGDPIAPLGFGLGFLFVVVFF